MAVDRCDRGEVERLLAAGADPNEFDSDGQTAMTVCAQSGDAELARTLIRAGARMDACGTSYIRTPLCFAAVRNDVELARVLVEAGSDVNSYQDGVTPLGCATRSGNLEMMRYLLECGAQVTDPGGKSMLSYINPYTKNREAVERLLREQGLGG